MGFQYSDEESAIMVELYSLFLYVFGYTNMSHQDSVYNIIDHSIWLLIIS